MRAEAWSTRAGDLRRLKIFDYQCLRRILLVYWKQFISNSEVHARWMQNFLPLETSSLVWSWIALMAVWLHARIHRTRPAAGLGEASWWTTANVAENKRERCGIDQGSALVWSLPLERWMTSTHLVDSFGLACLSGFIWDAVNFDGRSGSADPG